MTTRQPAAIFRKDLSDPGAKRFHFRHHRKNWEGLLILSGGKFYAYLNECRHVPIPLDLSSGDFFTADKRQLQCRSHGAMFAIDSGLCTEGPCEGKKLWALEVVEEAASVSIFIPEGFHVEVGEE